MRRAVLVFIIALATAAFCFAGGAGEDSKKGNTYRLAAIFPGSIQDADFNTLGYVALQEMKTKFKFETAYSEKVAVPDAERAIKEYINAGFNMIWIHGNQFNSAAFNVAKESPKVIFIVEVDGESANPLPNFWYLDRNYYTGFYVLGCLAAYKTQTGKIGFIGGLEMPFIRGEINAVNQAIRKTGGEINKQAGLEYVYVGDFNDTLKTRQAAEGLIAKGIDVIISAVNLGNFGLYSAVKESSKTVYITTTYTSKLEQAPDRYLTSDLFDYKVPLSEIVTKALSGTTSGYIKMDYGPNKARYAEFPIRNVPDDLNKKIKQIADDVAEGKIKVTKNLDVILP
jgi:basic membrane protein A and related proteins